MSFSNSSAIIKYIPLQQGLRHHDIPSMRIFAIIKYIPLQQGLRPRIEFKFVVVIILLSIFHYNKD